MTNTTVSTGHTSTGLTVDNGDFLFDSGTVISTMVQGGGTEEVRSAIGAISGGTASYTTVSGDAFELVSAGGTASFTAVSGGTQIVSSGGTTRFTTLSAGGSEEAVSAGGTASFTTVDSNSVEFVSSGGTADFTVVSGGGLEIVSSGGSSVSTTVLDNGTEDVDAHGTATFTVVSAAGFERVSSGGTASFTTLKDGTEFVFGGGTAVSTLVLDEGYQGIVSGGTASFTTVGSGGFEVVSSGGSATSTTLDLGGSIIIPDFVKSAGGTATVNSSTDVLSITEGSKHYTQQLAGSYFSTESLTVTVATVDFGGGTQVELEGTLCFCIDTLIETPTGRVKVQDLVVGELVMTRRGAARPITWIGTGAVLATRGRRSAATPVIVRKGALADNVPTQDLRVTKGHSLYIDHVLIPVEELVNHRSIEWDDRAQEVKLYHIELETHDVLIANGAPAESYRDDGNRWLFRNANDSWAQPPQEPCAPVLTGGKLVDEAWRRLLDRAGPRPGLPLTEDADLHLLVDGQLLDAVARDGETQVFRLAARPETVRIVSRAGAPQELGVARDPRVLGVALRRIVLRQGSQQRLIEAADATLAEGFHSYEPDNSFRWTDGDALLPAAMYDGLQGGFELELHVACSARYGADPAARAMA